MVGKHPIDNPADEFNMLLNDIDYRLSFSIKGKQTLDRAIDYASPAYGLPGFGIQHHPISGGYRDALESADFCQ